MSIGDHTILEVGGVLVHVIARDIVNYFSPLNPEQPLVVAPLDPLLDYVNMVKGGAPLRPNKILLDLPEDPSSRMTVINAMKEQGVFQQSKIVDRQQVVADLNLDPLLVTGWRALVLGALAVMLLLIIVGYFAYSFLIAIDRKVEVGVMRALGLSHRDIVRLIVLEHSLVLLIGLSVGTWAGLQISNFMLPLLSFTDFGRVIVPPFIIEISWPFVGALAIGIITSVVMTMGAHGIIFTRISAIEVLRTGDM
jgi:putative ABC transport system permease protein